MTSDSRSTHDRYYHIVVLREDLYERLLGLLLIWERHDLIDLLLRAKNDKTTDLVEIQAMLLKLQGLPPVEHRITLDLP